MNKPDVSYRSFPGEYNAINPADIPQGAAQRILNGVVRNQGVIEPIRGWSAQSFIASTYPEVIGVVDSSRYTVGRSMDNATSAGPAFSFGTGPSSLFNYYALDNLGNNNSTTVIRQWGWDLGVPPPTSSNNLAFFAAQRQGWLMTGRGLMKIERSSDNTSAPLAQVNMIPAQLFPLPVADQGFNPGGIVFGCSGSYVTNFNYTSPDNRNWLPAGYSVAYRLVMARKDPLTGQVRYSEPSDRMVLTNNTGQAGNVIVSVMVSYGAPQDGFVQIYRSMAVPAGVAPSDELFLVGELALQKADVSIPSYWGYSPTLNSGNVIILPFIDISPGRIDDISNAAIFVPLYTNRGLGNGIQATKYNPPVAAITGSFGGRAYYCNTQSQQTVSLFMAGTSPAGTSGKRGLSAGDTITVDGVVYTAVASGPFLQNFQYFDAKSWAAGTIIPMGYTTADASISAALRISCQSLVATINGYYNQTQVGLPGDRVILANYVSGGTGPGDVGQIILRRPFPGSPPFTVTTSTAQGWGQDYTKGVTSTNSAAAGGIIWSDLYQPDSCPLGNQTILGSAGAAITGFVALRDFAIIFKEDGAWTVRETARGPQFTPLDTTVKLVAPRTAVALGNECIALTAQGVVKIGEYGVENISIPIQREILQYLQRSQGLFQGAFAIGYEAEREYWLCLPSSSTITQADIVKIYNSKTNAWTTAKVGVLTCGAEIPTSSSTARVATTALAFGVASGYGSGSSPSYIGWTLENKSQSNVDYLLPTITPSLSNLSNNGNGTYRVTASPTWALSITVGSLVRAPSDTVQKTYIVAAVTLSADQSTLYLDLNLATPTTVPNLAGAYIQPAIVTQIRFMPEDAGAPLLEKHWDGIYLWHRYWNGSLMTTAWETEKTQFPIVGTEAGPGAIVKKWGFRPWCKTAWLSPANEYVLSTSMSGDYCRSGLLTPTFTYYNAQSRFELSCVTFNIASITDRIIIS